MSDTTFEVSPEVTQGSRLEKVDYIKELRIAFRRPIEATWLPKEPMVACDDEHALLSAIKLAFYDHLPLRLTPDAIWITLARGFAIHVQQNAEELRNRFVSHFGKEKIEVSRQDFLPGGENPWPEVFKEFRDQLNDRTGGLTSLIEADFSTTGPVERAVSHLMAMDTFQSYFEYELYAGCGIPQITLSGTVEDWEQIRSKVAAFAEYGLERWVKAVDPVLAQFVRAKGGNPKRRFWQSMFRYNSGSGGASLTGWVNTLFPYFKDHRDNLYPNPYLEDWQERLRIDSEYRSFLTRLKDPQGVGLGSIPSCQTSIPLLVHWGEVEVDLRLVGGLMGVIQNEATLEVQTECGWMVIYEEPVDPLSPSFQWIEDRRREG